MNILLIGSGGREHAFAYKLTQSTLCDTLFIAPGNAGTAKHGTNVALNPLDFSAVGEFCLANQIGLLIVGPEEPLVKGMRDYFMAKEALKDIPFVGPAQDGAQMEGSKDWSKAFMSKYHIPTAAYKTFTAKNLEEELYPLNEYHLIDIDIYAYLILAEGIRLNVIPSTSNDYAHLFYSDGRQIDYTEVLVSNMNKYTFVLKNESKLIPYIYQKKNPSTFAELGIDDFLVASSFVTHEDLGSIFENLNIFSNNKNII
jgi:hypothetical protein